MAVALINVNGNVERFLNDARSRESATQNGDFNMTFKKEEMQGNTTRLKIQGALNVYRAAAIREELIARLVHYESLELDLDGVTECDTVGIQLLWSTRKTAEKRDTRFYVVGAPKIVLDTIGEMGLNAADVILTGND